MDPVWPRACGNRRLVADGTESPPVGYAFMDIRKDKTKLTAREARQGMVVLRTPAQRALFVAGIVGLIALVALLAWTTQ